MRTHSQGHTGHADACQRSIRRVDFLLCPLCCESPLAEGWHHVVAALEWHRHQSRAEYQGPTIPMLALSESHSAPQLVGSVPPSAAKIALGEKAEGGWAAKAPPNRPWGRPPKSRPAIVGGGNSPPSSPERGGADSDGYSTMSKALGGRHYRRRQQNEKHLTAACLDMPIFKSTNPNVDVTYTLWRFDVQGWLDQYDESSMIPHIFFKPAGLPQQVGMLISRRQGYLSARVAGSHGPHVWQCVQL